MAETTTIGAINRALAEAMRGDERVIVLGEDVAEGGPFTATAGLAEEFGVARVINTPISEAAITGVAIGAAQAGLRPVLEIMYVDFLTLALDQLANAAAKAHFMSGGQLTVPLVVRTQGGAGHRGAAQHSQSLESWLAHVPGLKVVMPSRAADVPGLLASAIADPNPVVFIENKSLYFKREEVPDAALPVPIGRARVAREGGDVTIVALSRMVGESLAAAERLAAAGVEVVEAHPDLSTAPETFQALRAAGFVAGLGPLYDTDRDRLKPEIVGNIELGLALPPARLGEAERDRGRLVHEMAAFLREHSILLCPAACVAPFPIERRWVTEVDGVRFESYVEWLRITSALTLTGCPVMAVPCGFTAAGLPVGLQIVAPHGGESALLRAAAAIEAVLGVAGRQPPPG